MKTTGFEGLSAEMTTWSRGLRRRYRFGAQHLKQLRAAAEAWDQMCEAGAALKRDGLITVNRFGEKKAHPAVAIQRDARVGFLRCVRELALADDDMPTDNRPPRLKGYQGRH